MDKTINSFEDGGIIIFPTDTAYGVGCRIDNKDSVRKLNKLLKRPKNMPLPVLVDSIDMAKRYFQKAPKKIINLMKKYWPGGLTIVYFCKTELVESEVRGEQNTLGIRMPNHKAPLELIRKTNMPLIGTSANFHGRATPYSLNNVDSKLINKVDAVVGGECKLKQVSTVVDCTAEPWKILRQGTVDLL